MIKSKNLINVKYKYVKVKSFLLVHEILRTFHEVLHRLLHPMRDGHEGRADDEHPQRPGCLTEARPQDREGPEVSNESDQESEESNEHPKLNTGVGGDLLGKSFHGCEKNLALICLTDLVKSSTERLEMS